MTVGERACFAPPRQWYWRRHCWMRLRVVSRLCGFASLFVCQCTCVCVSYGVIASFVSSCTLSLLHCARVRIMSTVFAQDLWSHVCLIPRSVITSKGQMLRRSDVELLERQMFVFSCSLRSPSTWLQGTLGTTALSTFCAIAFAYCSTNERASARVAPLPFAPPSTICPTPLGRAFGTSLNDLAFLSRKLSRSPPKTPSPC